MSRVIVRNASYEYRSLRRHMFELLDAFIGGDISKGCRVVLKPNLLAPAPPEKGMLTHPMVVRSAVEYVLDQGGIPVVSDSPAMGSFGKLIEVSGIAEALDGLDVTCKEFKTSLDIDAGEPFHRIQIAEDALSADMLINLPKLKTHSQMLLTLGVKNLFGCVVGFRKPQWHLRTGIDRELFASLLVGIYSRLRPAVTVLDGVLAMEGQGPGKGGIPRHLGVLMAGNDAVALDFTVCRMIGLEPQELLTNRMSVRAGLANGPVAIDGDLPNVTDFKLPTISPVVFGPRWSHGFLRRHLVQRPVVEKPICRSCGDCRKYCPAKAISQEKDSVLFDYDKCIRCYCCLEVCPHGALKAEEPLIGKIVARFMGRTK